MDSLRYSAAHPYPYIPSPSLFLPSFLWKLVLRARRPLPWAFTPEPCPAPGATQRRDTADCPGTDHHPQGSPQELWSYNGRPWALGQTRYPTSVLTVAAGTGLRRPGCFMRVDPDTNRDTDEPLLNTNERVHSSARVRLALGGMAMDDRQTWPCAPLLRDDDNDKGRQQPVWRLERGGAVDALERARDEALWRRREEQQLEVGASPTHGGDDGEEEGTLYDRGAAYEVREGDGQWRWVFDEGAVVKNGIGHRVRPLSPVLPEEPVVGYWERHLLALMAGDMDVWRLAERMSLRESSPGKTV